MSGISDLKEIKYKLIQEDRIEDLLSSIGCEYIKNEQGGSLITAQLPDRFYSNNRRSVQVKVNKSLSCAIRSRADFSGDIFNLVSYIHFDKRKDELQEDLPKAKEFICKTFGWLNFLNYDNSVRTKDYTACLKEIIGKKQKKREIKPNPILDEKVLDEFYYFNKPLPYKDWIDEGISYNTQVMYGIGFCLESKRITIPMRNRFGQLVGVKARIMKNEDDDRKYLYLYSYQNRLEWFNFHYAHPYILSEKKVYIFEAEKSCMKAFSYGIFNTLAIGASEISVEQAETVKNLGLDVEIVLCYDKGISIDEIKKNAELFKGRKVSAMFDVDNLLNDKDSPIDLGLETFNQLLKNNVYVID